MPLSPLNLHTPPARQNESRYSTTTAIPEEEVLRTIKCQHWANKYIYFASVKVYCSFTINQITQSLSENVGDTSISCIGLYRQNLRNLKLSERECKSLNKAFHYRKGEKPIVFRGGQTYNQANSIKYINRTKWKWTSCQRISGNNFFHNGQIWGTNESGY